MCRLQNIALESVTDGQTDRQTDRQTDGQSDPYVQATQKYTVSFVNINVRKQ